MFQFDTIKVGGLRWARLGRVSVAVCVSREFRPFNAEARMARRRQFADLALGCAVAFAGVLGLGLPLVVGGLI